MDARANNPSTESYVPVPSDVRHEAMKSFLNWGGWKAKQQKISLLIKSTNFLTKYTEQGTEIEVVKRGRYKKWNKYLHIIMYIAQKM